MELFGRLEVDSLFEGRRIGGQIDAVSETPDGDHVILDDTATDRTRDIDTDLQLPLYVLACRELLDDTVTRAGYAYVGSAGQALDMRTFDDSTLADAMTRIREHLDAAASSSYATYEQGDHCSWCPHANLPCGQATSPPTPDN